MALELIQIILTKCLRYGYYFQDRDQGDGTQGCADSADHLAKGNVLSIYGGAKGRQPEGRYSGRNVSSDTEGLIPISTEDVGQKGAKDHSQGVAGETKVLPEYTIAPFDVFNTLKVYYICKLVNNIYNI